MLVLVFGLVDRVGEGKHMCIVYCGSSLIDDIFMPELGEESTLCGHKDWCRVSNTILAYACKTDAFALLDGLTSRMHHGMYFISIHCGDKHAFIH